MKQAEELMKAFTDLGFKVFAREPYDFQVRLETGAILMFEYNYEGTELQRVRSL